MQRMDLPRFYMIAMSTRFRAGCVENFLTNESVVKNVLRLVLMACWLRWLECVGIADRSAFDLNAHARVLLSGLKVRCCRLWWWYDH